jgi:hypothetical protein
MSWGADSRVSVGATYVRGFKRAESVTKTCNTFAPRGRTGRLTFTVPAYEYFYNSVAKQVKRRSVQVLMRLCGRRESSKYILEAVSSSHDLN